MPDAITCGHCRYSGPPPEEARREIYAAIAVLRGMSTRRRQLGGLQRRAITRSWLYSALFLVVLVLVVAPFALFALVLVLGPGPDNVWLTATLGFGPLLLVLLSGAAGVWWLRRSRQKLLESCAAAPPAAPGEPARCHVCGASLQAGAKALVRCGYCQADNIVTNEAMARVAHRQAVVTTGLEDTVRRNASSFGMQTLLVNGFVVVMALGAPVACFAVAVIVLMGLSQMELPPDETVHYVRYPTPAGECLARVETKDGKRILNFKDPPAPGMAARLSVPTDQKLSELSIKDLVGLEVVGPENRVLKVKRVLRTEVDRSVNLLRMVDHEEMNQDVEAMGTCFPRTPRIAQLAHRDALMVDDVHDMATDGKRLVLATGDLELLSKTGGAVTSVSTADETHAVEAQVGALFTLSRVKDEADWVHDLELRNASGGVVRQLAQNSVHRSPFTSNARYVYYVQSGLFKVSWSGGEAEQIATGSIHGAAADDAGVYYLTGGGVLSSTYSLSFAPNDGAPRELCREAHAAGNPQLTVAGQRLLWLAEGDQLMSLDTKGGAPTSLGRIEGARGIRADARSIYVALTLGVTRHQIVRLPADATSTTNLTVVAPRASSVEAMVLEPEALYWVDGAYVMKLPRGD